MAITEIKPSGLLMPMVEYEATKAVIEAKTIEACRVALLAKLKRNEARIAYDQEDAFIGCGGKITIRRIKKWLSKGQFEKMVRNEEGHCV